MFIVWMEFAVSAALIIWAGTSLTKNADLIAEKTGLGILWAGALLLPMATSLPEIVTSCRAAAINAPDIALGNVFGSNTFNVTLIAFVDLLSPGPPVLRQVKIGHILTAAMAIALTSFISVNMIYPSTLSFLGVGLECWFVFIFYIAGTRLLLRYEKRYPVLKGDVLPNNLEGRSLFRGIISFILAGAVIMFAGTLLADTGKIISHETGLGETLVGTIFIAIATSLPELVTTASAARMGLPDMAVGNIFGSNFLNLSIVFFADIFYRPGQILKNVSIDQFFTAQASIFLMALAIVGLIYRSNKTVARLGLDSIALILTYLIVLMMLF